MRRGLLTRRGQAFLLVGALLTLTGIGLGYPDVTRIGILLVILPLLAMLWIWRRLPRIRVTRQIEPARLAADERGSVDVTFVNTGSRGTTSYLAEEQFDYALGDRPRFLLPHLPPGDGRSLSYPIRSRYRGAYHLGPVRLQARDPFGLTQTNLVLPRTDQVLVLPRTFSLGARVKRGTGRGAEGERPQMMALHGEDDVSIRSYRQGDELRRVHWPATAHRGELMVRQEDQPSRRRAVILLDDRADAHSGHGYSPSFEWSVSAAASIAQHLMLDDFVVHLLTDATVRDGVATHQLELDPLMTTLARARLTTGVGLERAVALAHEFTAGGVLVIAVVSAHDPQQLTTLSAIRQPGHPAVAILVDAGSFESGRTRGPAASTQVEAHRAILTNAGWQTALARSGASIPQVWESLARHAAHSPLGRGVS